MSVLSFPRVNFRGVFRTNPCTANNDDVMPDVVERDSDTLGPALAAMTDDAVRDYLRQTVTMSNGDGWECRPYLRSGWNLYGDHTTAFDDTVVTSIVTGPAASQRLTTPAQDPLIGRPVRILGSASSDPMRRGSAMLCDLDPTGLVTTQLFIGGLQIGDGGAGGADPKVLVDHDVRAFQDWLHFNATVSAQAYAGEQNFVGIGCLMQFALPVSALPAEAAVSSPGLRALVAAARGAAGLVVRFRCFEVEPQLTDEALAAGLPSGLANPSLGYLVGTIGVWEEGEPATEPAGRKLMAPYPRAAMQWQDAQGTPHSVPGGPTPWQAPPALVGNVVARVQPTGSVISLDLVDAFPKDGFRNPSGPGQPDAGGFGAPRRKANLGPVELAVVPAGGGAAISIAAVDYGVNDYATYDDFGGIVDLPYDPAAASLIAGGTLVLRGAAGNTINPPAAALVQESRIRVVTDDRALYWAPHATNVVRLKVFEAGAPPAADVVLYLSEYFNIIATQTGPSCTDGVRPNQTVQPSTAGILTFPATVTFPSGGTDWLVVPVAAIGSGATLLSYQLSPTVFGAGAPHAGVPVWSYADYSSIRVFAEPDYSALYAAGDIAWADVYREVLRFYYLIYPAMSRYIPLNAVDAVVGQGALIAERVHTPDDPRFFSTYNMPVTRTMPPAKVTLLLTFLEQQQAKRTARAVRPAS